MQLFTWRIQRQGKWAGETFGPGQRAEGVLDHISKEIEEIRKDPSDLEEWIDILILASDGAMREGYSARDIWRAWKAKNKKNRNRQWPDWRTQDPNKAIEHLREFD